MTGDNPYNPEKSHLPRNSVYFNSGRKVAVLRYCPDLILKIAYDQRNEAKHMVNFCNALKLGKILTGN